MLLGLCFGAGASGLVLLAHLAAMRLVAPAGRARIDRISFLLGLLAIPASLGLAMPMLGESAWTHGGWLLGSLWGILEYFAVFTLYMPFFFTVATSLSVATIVMLARQADGALPLSALFDRFGSRTLIEGRLAVMVRNGVLVREGSDYQLTAKGRRVARAFAVLKRFWRLEPGG